MSITTIYAMNNNNDIIEEYNSLRGSEIPSKFHFPVPICATDINKDGSVCLCCNPNCPEFCCCPMT
jgi:hypothetical protein